MSVYAGTASRALCHVQLGNTVPEVLRASAGLVTLRPPGAVADEAAGLTIAAASPGRPAADLALASLLSCLCEYHYKAHVSCTHAWLAWQKTLTFT